MDNLPEEIIKWVDENNRVETMRSELRELTETHRITTAQLIENLRANAKTKIKISDGYLQLESEKKPLPLSFKKLQEVLEEYFEDETNRAASCIHFIKSNFDSNEEGSVIKRYKN